MRASLALTAVLALLGAPAGAEEEVGYSFFLGDERIYPPILSLSGTPDRPRGGDLARVSEVWITLDAPGTYRFREGGSGRLLLAIGDAPESIAAVTAACNAGEVGNPFASMSADEIRRLRGLRLEYWDETILEQTHRIDPSSTCVTLAGPGAEGDPLAGLPATLERLCVERFYDSPFPLTGSIGRLRSLRALVAHTAVMRDSYGFRELAELRLLGLSGVEGLTDIGFVAGMPRLTVLGIAYTEVRDLSPLDVHPALAYVHANGAPLATLPAGRLPALREIEAFGARWDDDQRAAFLLRNPGCTLRDRWAPALADALRACDRIRVRSGGTCCRNEICEETLFEVRDPAEIRGLIAGIRILEASSGGACMCCGFPTLEFGAGHRLLAMVGFHHGSRLRWPDGPWPGDAVLTAEGAAHLAGWLAGHGLDDPDAAERRYWGLRFLTQGYEDILGGWSEVERAWCAPTAEEKEAVLRAAATTAEARTVIWLRLLGCHEGAWDHAAGLDPALLRLLDSVAPDVLDASLAAAVADEAGCAGAARWLLGEGRWTMIGGAQFGAALPGLARSALAHPKPRNRRRALIALGGIGGPESIAALRAFLAGEIEPRRMAPVGAAELGPPLPAPEEPEAIRRVDSERVLAAYYLARLRDLDSLPAILELAAGAEGADAELLRNALASWEPR